MEVGSVLILWNTVTLVRGKIITAINGGDNDANDTDDDDYGDHGGVMMCNKHSYIYMVQIKYVPYQYVCLSFKPIAVTL